MSTEHAAFAAKYEDAARKANAAYLDGLGAWGVARRAQEYDQLNESGKALWRVVVMVSCGAMGYEI